MIDNEQNNYPVLVSHITYKQYCDLKYNDILFIAVPNYLNVFDWLTYKGIFISIESYRYGRYDAIIKYADNDDAIKLINFDTREKASNATILEVLKKPIAINNYEPKIYVPPATTIEP